WATRGLAENATVLTHRPFGCALNVAYGAQRPCIELEKVTDPPPKDVTEGVLLVDARKVSSSELRGLARFHGVTVVGPFWRVDRTPGRMAPPPFVVLTLEEHTPRGLERLALASDLVRTIEDVVDPWATWDWRTHLGLSAAPPNADPSTFEELR